MPFVIYCWWCICFTRTDGVQCFSLLLFFSQCDSRYGSDCADYSMADMMWFTQNPAEPEWWLRLPIGLYCCSVVLNYTCGWLTWCDGLGGILYKITLPKGLQCPAKSVPLPKAGGIYGMIYPAPKAALYEITSKLALFYFTNHTISSAILFCTMTLYDYTYN